MSKIAFDANDQGTGVLTIASPDTNNDRTLTLPDETGTVLTSGTDLANFPSGFANGVTEADQFRLVADTSGGASGTLSNLDRVDDASFAKIGTGMTESSGVFTFPSTGLYLVIAVARAEVGDTDTSANLEVEVSSDSGSNFDTVGFATAGNTSGTAGATFTAPQNFFVNVTNASTFRIKFSANSLASDSLFSGATTDNRTCFTFIRLGDSQ